MRLGVVVLAACPPNGDCGEFGVCLNDTRSCGDNCQDRCKCAPGYYGFDCSFVAQVCPDDVIGRGEDEARECYNGGTCYKVQEVADAAPGGENVFWRCDCRHSYGDAAIYAGHQCEYPLEVSCENGKSTSTYAFCVNDGACLAVVEAGEPHPGCKCPTDFEGRHCQYAAGTAPPQELVYSPSASTKHGMSGIALFFIVVAALMFVGTISCMAWQYHRRSFHDNGSSKEVSFDMPEVKHELSLSPNNREVGDNDAQVNAAASIDTSDREII